LVWVAVVQFKKLEKMDGHSKQLNVLCRVSVKKKKIKTPKSDVNKDDSKAKEGRTWISEIMVEK
jgi:hypothetical protein